MSLPNQLTKIGRGELVTIRERNLPDGTKETEVEIMPSKKGAVAGAAAGGVVAGPVGALIGGIIGGIFGPED